MLDAFQVKKPFYPLISFAVSLLVLVFGMLFSKSYWSFAFAGVLFLLYSCFGLFKGLWKMTVSMLACGLVIGGLAFITNHNFDAFWQTVVRFVLIGMCAVPMVTTSPANLTRCLTQLHCPRVITLGMLVTLRFIPILVTEVKRIWEAMRVRGANVNWYRPSSLYRAFFIPLMMRIIGISDTLSLSLETRAFTLDDAPATVYGRVELHARDIVFLVVSVVACVGTGVLVWTH